MRMAVRRMNELWKTMGLALMFGFLLLHSCRGQDPLDLAADPATDPAVDPAVDPAADPTADPAADPAVDPAADPTADPAADPAVDPAADPTADPAVDPAADPTADPAADPTVDPAEDPTVVPATDPAVDPAANPTVDPAVDPAADPTADPAADPAVDPAADPTADPAVDPAADPTADPAVDPAADPAVDPAAANPRAGPAVDQISGPAVQGKTDPGQPNSVDTTDMVADASLPTSVPEQSETQDPKNSNVNVIEKILMADNTVSNQGSITADPNQKKDENAASRSSPAVFMSVLVTGLLLTAIIAGIYYFKCHRRTNSKGMKLAEESYMADEENQGNTLVSVAPLNQPETQEKPSLNGESQEAVKAQTPPAATNGHSTTKTADTEL